MGRVVSQGRRIPPRQPGGPAGRPHRPAPVAGERRGEALRTGGPDPGAARRRHAGHLRRRGRRPRREVGGAAGRGGGRHPPPGLRAGGGRRRAGEPHALRPLLSREARVLPGERGHLRLRLARLRRNAAVPALLLTAHRYRKGRRERDPRPGRGAALGAGGPADRGVPGHAHRCRSRAAFGQLRRAARQARPAAERLHRRDDRRPPGHRRGQHRRGDRRLVLADGQPQRAGLRGAHLDPRARRRRRGRARERRLHLRPLRLPGPAPGGRPGGEPAGRVRHPHRHPPHRRARPLHRAPVRGRDPPDRLLHGGAAHRADERGEAGRGRGSGRQPRDGQRRQRERVLLSGIDAPRRAVHARRTGPGAGRRLSGALVVDLGQHQQQPSDHARRRSAGDGHLRRPPLYVQRPHEGSPRLAPRPEDGLRPSPRRAARRLLHGRRRLPARRLRLQQPAGRVRPGAAQQPRRQARDQPAPRPHPPPRQRPVRGVQRGAPR